MYLCIRKRPVVLPEVFGATHQLETVRDLFESSVPLFLSPSNKQHRTHLAKYNIKS